MPETNENIYGSAVYDLSLVVISDSSIAFLFVTLPSANICYEYTLLNDIGKASENQVCEFLWAIFLAFTVLQSALLYAWKRERERLYQHSEQGLKAQRADEGLCL